WQCFGELEARRPYASIYTSLGCPYKCTFCCINAPFGTNRYRMRSPDAVAAEIDLLHNTYGVKTYKIIDEMFVLNERHVLGICDLLIERNYVSIFGLTPASTQSSRTCSRSCGVLASAGLLSGSNPAASTCVMAPKNHSAMRQLSRSCGRFS